MREQVREQLPPTVVALMDEIEAFAGVEIQFQPYDFSLESLKGPGAQRRSAPASPALGRDIR